MTYPIWIPRYGIWELLLGDQHLEHHGSHDQCCYIHSVYTPVTPLIIQHDALSLANSKVFFSNPWFGRTTRTHYGSVWKGSALPPWHVFFFAASGHSQSVWHYAFVLKKNWCQYLESNIDPAMLHPYHPATFVASDQERVHPLCLSTEIVTPPLPLLLTLSSRRVWKPLQ